MRAPAYDATADVKVYWAELAAIMLAASDRPIVFAGDINQNPLKRAGMRDVPSLSFPLCPAYSVPNPVGEWSCMSPNGRGLPTRIDHVLHAERVTITGARYIALHDGQVLAGLRTEQPISDHAPLAFTATC
jgi:endonuclease/exonuclease/phosphatase family metal-dependent hydrolase